MYLAASTDVTRSLKTVRLPSKPAAAIHTRMAALLLASLIIPIPRAESRSATPNEANLRMGSSFTLGRGALFERYYRELLNFLARKVGDREFAADLAQESYARVYAAPGKDDVAEPRALLYTTARNLVIDHHRRVTVRAQVELADESGIEMEAAAGPASSEPDAVLSGRQRLAAIEDALAHLPPRPREAFVLYKLDGLSRAEVASQMGVSVRTVETHLEIAMDACLRRLQALDGVACATGASAVKKPRKSE